MGILSLTRFRKPRSRGIEREALRNSSNLPRLLNVRFSFIIPFSAPVVQELDQLGDGDLAALAAGAENGIQKRNVRSKVAEDDCSNF